MSFDYAKPASVGDTSRPPRHHVSIPSFQASTAASAFDHDFHVGEWLVQPSLDRISSPAADIRLRPQVMNMLVCLARGRGRTISREQILDAVWPGQSVADTSIARCVAELRKAMGDRVQAPTVVETIPKRGYRLIAPVSVALDTDRERRPPGAAAETTFPGPSRVALRVVAGAGAGPRPVPDNPVQTTPEPSGPGQPGAPASPATAAVAVPETGRRRTTGFPWVAGLVAAVRDFVWPSASR